MQIMSTLRKTCLFLVLFGLGQTRACSKTKIYHPGDNVTVSIDAVRTNRQNQSEIFFCGSTSKQHFTNVMLYHTISGHEDTNDVNRNYTGRITNLKMTNGSLSFMLLNVTFTDSGNFTDSRNSCEKAKCTIIVTRRRLTASVDEIFILDFMYKITNTSLVIINQMGSNDCRPLAIFSLKQKNCTYVMDGNLGRVTTCEFKEATLRLTFASLTWHNKDTYIAWDDTGLLLDSIFIDIRDWFPPSLIAIVVVVLLVAAGTANIALYKRRQRRENNTLSPLGTSTTDSSSHKDHVTSSPPSISIPDSSSHKGEHESNTLSPLGTSTTDSSSHKGKNTNEEEINCSDPDVRMFQVTNTAFQSDDDTDERQYDEPRSNDMELTACIEPISQPVNVYEILHPYENQGNTMYRSLRPEDVI